MKPPDLAKRGDLLALHFGALGLGQAGDGAAHVHGFGGVGFVFVQALHLRIELALHLVPAACPQLQKTGLLRSVGKRLQHGQRLSLGHLQRQAVAQQHGQELGRWHGAAHAGQRGQKAVAELPLGDFFGACAQVVKQGVELVQLVGAQGRAVGRGFSVHRCTL